MVAGRADTLRQGVELASETISSGAAADLLARLQARAWVPAPTGEEAPA
jgi:anthranilate phosphoribosyltransferase